MIHYIYAYSAQLDKELSQFEFHGMLGGEHTQDTTEKVAKLTADEFAGVLNESAHLTATDWAGTVKTSKPE